jgi:hypothetical protein
MSLTGELHLFISATSNTLLIEFTSFEKCINPTLYNMSQTTSSSKRFEIVSSWKLLSFPYGGSSYYVSGLEYSRVYKYSPSVMLLNALLTAVTRKSLQKNPNIQIQGTPLKSQT